MPALPIPGDNPVQGYMRPSQMDDGVTLELALVEGRWDVRFADQACAPGPWSDVAFGPGAFVDGCELSGASWRSDAPCAQDDEGECEVLADDSYWYALSLEPTLTPADPPASAPAVAARPAARPAAPVAAPARAVAPPSAPMPRAVSLPAATPTPRASTTPTPTITPVPTATPTVTVTATRTPAATPTRTPVPAVVAPVVTPTPEPGPPPFDRVISWTALLVLLGTLGFVGGTTYVLYRIHRRRYQTQLAALEATDE